MKTILSILFLLLSFCIRAQIVDIPDPNFKKALLDYPITNGGLEIDLNHDGEIQVSEAEVVTRLTISPYPRVVDMTGIRAFKNLQFFGCYVNELTTLDVSGLAFLEGMDCTGNKLTSLNTTGCSMLSELHCDNNPFSTLDLTNLGNLKRLYCQQCPQLTALNITGLSNLESLYCAFNQLSTLDVSGCSGLTNIICNNNALTTLDLRPAFALQGLICSGNSLHALNLNGLTNLANISCQNNALTSLDLSSLSNLENLFCNGNHLATLDLSNCPKLINLQCNNNNELQAVNLKNGNTDLIYQNLILASQLQYICADEQEIDTLVHYLGQNNMLNVNVSSYCSFTPGGKYNTIVGTIRFDQDNNGCDTNDPVMPGIKIKLTGTADELAYTGTDTAGSYDHYMYGGTFTITPEFQNPFFTISPANTTISFANALHETQVADFCITPEGSHNDVEIVMLPGARARPGFEATYQLLLKNKGTTTLSGTIRLNFDDAKLDFVTSNPAMSTQSIGEVTWGYADLKPFESRTIDTRFNVLPPPINNLDDTLTFLAVIDPVNTDEIPEDNSFALKQVVRGSFDPNDKACLEGDAIDITRIGDYVHYLIRFQNTGTDTAENVVVKDLLEDNYDWNSFELTSSSHPCIIRKDKSNKLEFVFEKIMLPGKSVNEPASNGFIAFKIRSKSTLLLGDQLNNTAAIYFDYNLPVITNTVSSIITNELPNTPIVLEYFNATKKPGGNELNWKAHCNTTEARFDIERSTDGNNFKVTGKITATNTRCLLPFYFTDKDPSKGTNYYRIKMTEISGPAIYSRTIALVNAKAGLNIINVSGTKAKEVILNIESGQSRQINITITDASGKTIHQMTKNVTEGNNEVNIGLKNAASGIYFIIVYTKDGDKQVKRFFKQ